MSLKNFLKPKIKKLLKQPFIIKIVSFFIFIYAQFVGMTTRWKIENAKEIIEILSKPAILIGWHARVVMLPYFWCKYTYKKKLYALVSPHQDGQLITNFLKFYGIDTISGSTNQNANQSALEIMRLLKEGQNVCISPDGPIGPRMRMKKSPIYFASKTGLPIVFANYSTSRAKVVQKAWDKTMIALPFGHGVFMLSNPIHIPENLTDEQIEEYRLKVEEIANKISFACDIMVGRNPVEPASPDEKIKRRG